MVRKKGRIVVWLEEAASFEEVLLPILRLRSTFFRCDISLNGSNILRSLVAYFGPNQLHPISIKGPLLACLKKSLAQCLFKTSHWAKLFESSLKVASNCEDAYLQAGLRNSLHIQDSILVTRSKFPLGLHQRARFTDISKTILGSSYFLNQNKDGTSRKDHKDLLPRNPWLHGLTKFTKLFVPICRHWTIHLAILP